MKNLLLSFGIILLTVITVFAQTPEKINYQGVARDLAGNVLANDAISLRISLRRDSLTGAIYYRETHSVTTNIFGLFNVQIGGGTVVTGTLAGITWGSNTFFVEIEMDPAGGSSYTSLGTSQLISVPYALYAKSSASTSAIAGATNYIPKFTGSSSLGNSSIFDDGTYVGIGTTTPQWNFQVNSAGVESVLQLTSASSGSGDLDGLLINSGSSGNASITNMEAGGHLALSTQGGGMMLSSTGNVGVGISPPSAKLDVLFWQNPDAASGAIKGRVNLTSTDMYGVQGLCNATPYFGYGVKGNGGWYGGYFEARLTGTDSRFGVYGYAGGTSDASYGVYGEAGGSGTNYAGFFSGNVFSTGTYTPSDADLKFGVKDYNNAMAMITRIPVKTYSYKNEGVYGKMHLPEGKQVGIMAQDMERVFPQLVKETTFEDTRSYHDGLIKKEDIESINFKAVNYTGLVPVIVKAMQEQNKKIDDQQQLINQLMQRIEKLEAK